MRLFVDPMEQATFIVAPDWPDPSPSRGRILGSQGRAAAPVVRPMMPSSVAFFLLRHSMYTPAYVRSGLN